MSEPGTDIVERLREHREKPTADPDIVQISEPSELALEAADTITHLRSEVEAWGNMVRDPVIVRMAILRGTIVSPPDLVWLHDTNGPVAEAIDAERMRMLYAVRDICGLELAYKVQEATAPHTRSGQDTSQSPPRDVSGLSEALLQREGKG